MQLRATQGETLDLVIRRAYGTVTADLLAAALEANPGLAALGPILPTGTLVSLPDADTTTPTVTTITLWN